MAVKNHNTYNLSSNAGDVTQYTRADGDLSDTMPQGAKFGDGSVSDSNVHTNYTKNRQNYAALAESGYDNKKTKKGKKLPKIFDEHRITPKIQRMQYSTEFLKGGKGRKGAYASAVH